MGTTPYVGPIPDLSDAVGDDDSRLGAVMTTAAELVGLQAAIDLLPFAVIVVQRDATVQRINRGAADLFRTTSALAINSRRLHAARPLDTASLRHAVADVAQRSSTHPGTLVTRVWRPRGSGCLAAVLAARVGAEHLRTQLVTLLVFDGSILPALDPRVLRTLYGLTPAEARIAAMLAAGQTAADLSRQMRISLNTTRTHIRRVLSKVGCSRQPDLVRHLLSSAAHLRWPGA